MLTNINQKKNPVEVQLARWNSKGNHGNMSRFKKKHQCNLLNVEIMTYLVCGNTAVVQSAEQRWLMPSEMPVFSPLTSG
jgi:hypothetical protein